MDKLKKLAPMPELCCYNFNYTLTKLFITLDVFVNICQLLKAIFSSFK